MDKEEFKNKLDEFEKSLEDTSDLLDELYLLTGHDRSPIHDYCVCISANMDSIYGFINEIEKELEKEEKNNG